MTPSDIKAWRESLGYSQSAAADALGVTKTTYQAMERGRSFATDKPVAIDKRTALACAAISAGLQPWGATAADAPSTPS